ncbi:MAG: rane protein [Nocardioides sp.]|nr:rane protein [Nocardioides sp.]
MAKEPKAPKTPKVPKIKETDPTKMSRRRQIIETYKMSRETDKRLGLWMLGGFLLFGAIGFVLAYLPFGGGTFGLIIAIIVGLLMGFLGLMVVFSRRAQQAAYHRLEGRLGGGAQALTMLRRGWKVEQMVGFTKQQDMVHRVVGPPGIVLVGEGNANRLRALMVSERKKHERVASEVPIHEVVVGGEEGQVPISKLVRHVQKLGRQVKPAEITDILMRLRALDAQRPKVPLPRGPVPTSMKGMRGNMRGR